MTKYMKALQVIQPRFFQLVQTPVPELDTGQEKRILVQPGWVSLCGSDIPFFTGNKRFRSYPLPIGGPIHECVGRVIQSTSNQFHQGDRVVAIPDGDQGLAEFFVARADKAVIIPDDLVDRGASCLIQPLATVINAIDRLGNLEGKSVAVIGLGSIGILFCWLLRQRKAASVLGVDPLEYRCHIAGSMGATRTYQLRSIEVVHALRQGMSDWEPPDICIEAVGHQMETLSDCFELVRKQGIVLAFGVPDQPVYAIEYETFFRKNIQLMAVVTPEWSEYLPISRDLFLEHRATLETLVTHRAPILEAAKIFTLYERHEDGVIKAVMDASSW